MKYFCIRLSIAALLILTFCLSGCAALQPVSSEPEQFASPVTESLAGRPIDELTLPGFDVKTSILWDINGDGTKETISIGQGDAREIGYDILFSVSDSGNFNTITVGSGYFEKADYLITAGGEPGVVLSISYEDDHSSTFLVSFDGLKPVLHGSVDGTFESASGSGMTVRSWIDALGTWPCIGCYNVTDDFSFELYNDCYYIDTTDLDPLITCRDLSVRIWKDTDYAPETLEAGTSIIPYYTDGKTYMEFYVKYPGQDEYTGGRIDFIMSGDKFFIGGKSEYDCFEVLPYAG